MRRDLLVCLLGVFSSAILLSPATLMAQQNDDSYFRITPYMWFLGVEGTTAVLGQDVDAEADFSDILDVLNIALMVSMEWNRNHWFLYLDPIFASLEADFESPGPLPVSGSVEADLLIIELGVGYEINDNFDVYAGTRYFDADITVVSNMLASADIGDD